MLVATGCERASVPVLGNIFIVTRGGPSIKLGLVTVSAYDQETATARLTAYQINQRSAWLVATKEADTAQGAVDADTEGYTKIKDSWETARDMAAKYRDSPPFQRLALNLWTAFVEQNKAYSEKLSAAADARANVEAIVSESALLESLGAPNASAKTNADGEFEMMLAQGHRYLIAAQAKRDLPGPESYYWLISVRPDKHAAQLILSNDNVISADPVESPIKIAAWLQMAPEFLKAAPP